MSYPKSGPASRAVALDLVLRTFMNSAEFHPSNPKIWDNIAKLVPGTTPQQCSQRWEELRATSQNIVGDYKGLTAQGRPMSAHTQNHRRQLTKSLSSTPTYPTKSSQSESVASYTEPRPSSVLSPSPHVVTESHALSMGVGQSGTFVANFCQSVLSGGEREEGMRACTGEKGSGVHSGMKSGNNEYTNGSSTQSGSSKPTNDVVSDPGRVNSSVQLGSLVGKHGPNMVIHVCDEAKKLRRDFTCPRDVLVREMRYFAGYLSSDTQLWDEVDISVHCDVPVFEWLMRYVKRGILEGPSGEVLSEEPPAPQLEPGNTVSILISSDFLKMDNLVEECLDFCHKNISAVVASPSNMGCLNDRLVGRLAAKFTPLEVEKIVDKKNKIKSKLFIHHLQQLFSLSYSIPECPANAATLYKCRHCSRLLTAEQQTLLPCNVKRLSIDCTGKVIYSHERDPGWDVTHHLQCMQREGLSPRDIYWRLWGVVNWLVCERCQHPFQCGNLPSCAYHPQPSLPSSSTGGNLHHPCCQQPVSSFSVMHHQQNGCTFRDHAIGIGRTTTPLHSSSPSSATRTSSSRSEQLCIKDESTTERVYSVLLALREVICEGRLQDANSKRGEGEMAVQEICLLQNEERKLRQHSSGITDAPHVSQLRERDGTDYTPSNMILLPSSSRQPLIQGVTMTTRKQSNDLSDLEEDDDEEDIPTKPKKSRQTHPRSKQTRSDNQYPPLPVEWIWDSRKSKRWNQDMQRESDERRLAVLSLQLSHMNTSSEHSSKGKEAGHAGGIFSQLEAQFRAQQAARALAAQATQARLQGSGRRKSFNVTQHC